MDSPPGLDELTSEPVRRTPILVALAVVTVVAVVLVGTTTGSSHRARRAAPRPPATPPATAAPSVSPVARVTHLAVLFEPLPGCTRTSPDGHLHTAMAVTDFSERPVRLLSVEAAAPPPGLEVVGVRLGHAPCGADGAASAVSLAPWQDAVVGLDVASATRCPPGSFGLRVTFDTADGIRHADSSSVVDLSRPGCP